MTAPQPNLERLLKLRTVVARFGEMDGAQWWNTKGQLGPRGTFVLRRGFPRTHSFAQARSVFAVAAARCAEVFDPPESVTLFRLTEAIEEDLDNRWDDWLDHAADWRDFFLHVEALPTSDLPAVLRTFGLVDDTNVAAASKLKRTAEGRAVALPTVFTGTDDDITMLALGFARGEPGKLAVPYARRAES